MGQYWSDGYMNHAGGGRYGTALSEQEEHVNEESAVPVRDGSQLQGKFVWIGIVAGDSDLYFYDDAADAVKFLEDDPARSDTSAMAPSRRVWQAQLSTVTQVQLLKPVPARLATSHNFNAAMSADPDHWKTT